MNNEGYMITPNMRLAGIVGIVAVLLLIPFIAMRLIGEFSWSPFDFIVAGVLLLGTGLAIEAVIRFVTKTSYRIILALAILAVLALIWIEVAVGLFGTPLAGS
jgi:hypothetical protein